SALATLLGGCGLVLGITDGTPRSNSSSDDAVSSVGTGGNAGAGAGGAGGSGGAVVVYNDVKDPNNWATFVISSAPGLKGPFQGGSFDGKYVYLSPTGSQVVARYDTTGSFASAASWSGFGVKSASPIASNYNGGAIVAAGGLQLVPFSDGTNSYGFTLR